MGGKGANVPCGRSGGMDELDIINRQDLVNRIKYSDLCTIPNQFLGTHLIGFEENTSISTYTEERRKITKDNDTMK